MSDSKNDQNGTKRDQGNPFGNQGAPGPKPKFNLYWFYGIIAVMFLVVNYYFSGSKGPVETNWNKVKTIMLAQHDIDRIVVINNEKALLYLKEDRVAKYKDELEGTFTKPAVGGPHFYWTIGSVETFEQKLMEAQEGFAAPERVEAEYRNERNWVNEILWSLGPFLLLILLWFWFFRRMSKGGGGPGGGIFSVGKSQARVFDKDSRVNTTFRM